MASNKVEKTDIEKVVDLLRKQEKVCALLAPAVEKIFGNSVQKEMFYKVLLDVGFCTWRQIAEEADRLVLQEIEEWKSRTEDKRIILSSSCPAIVRLVEQEYPDLSMYLSNTKSPMQLASLRVKEKNASIKTVFVGPCYWKKEEQKKHLNSGGHVDVVLTFPEFVEVVKKMGVDFQWEFGNAEQKNMQIEGLNKPGEIAKCVEEKMQEMNLEKIPQFIVVTGVKECKDVFKNIRNDKYQNCYIELMACKKGCSTKNQ